MNWVYLIYIYTLRPNSHFSSSKSIRFVITVPNFLLLLIRGHIGGVDDLSITIQERDALIHHEIADEDLVKAVEPLSEGEEPGEDEEESLKNVDDDHGAEEELDGEGVDQAVNSGLSLGVHLLEADVFLVEVGAEVAAVEDGEVEEEGGGDGAFPAVLVDEELAEEGDAEVEGDGHGGLHAEEEAVGDDEHDGGEPRHRVVEETGHEEDRPVCVGDDGEEEPELRQPRLVVAAQRPHFLSRPQTFVEEEGRWRRRRWWWWWINVWWCSLGLI